MEYLEISYNLWGIRFFYTITRHYLKRRTSINLQCTNSKISSYFKTFTYAFVFQPWSLSYIIPRLVSRGSLIIYRAGRAWRWDHVVATFSFGKYKRDVDDAQNFTAAYSRRISCGRNRAGHSRDCVEYSFPGALSFSLTLSLFLFSFGLPAASGENICCFTIWHTRSLLVFLALTQCENVAFTERQGNVIAQISTNEIHYAPQTYKPNITFSSGTKFISVGRIGKRKVRIFQNLFQLRSAEFHIDMDD